MCLHSLTGAHLSADHLPCHDSGTEAACQQQQQFQSLQALLQQHEESIIRAIQQGRGLSTVSISKADNSVVLHVRATAHLDINVLDKPLRPARPKPDVEPFGWDDRQETAQADRCLFIVPSRLQVHCRLLAIWQSDPVVRVTAYILVCVLAGIWLTWNISSIST